MRRGKRRKKSGGFIQKFIHCKPQHKYLMGVAAQTGERFCLIKEP